MIQFPSIKILAIESSCDDTSAAVLQGNKILANFIANQKVHAAYGGVVPELASREHQKNIVPVVHEAGVTADEIEAVAFTQGPGLLGSLMVGTSFAKSFAAARGIPLIGVNHMKAHILAHFIEDAGPQIPELPLLCLTVSGGHTQLVLVEGVGEMRILGETMDDAAGEAFDKTAKIMGLPYPGGPLIDKLAEEGDPHKFEFSKARVNDYQFSFSGFKTSVLRLLQKEMAKDDQFIDKNKVDLCASVRYTIVSTLIEKLERAAQDLGVNQIAIAGGVSANALLRRELKALGEKHGWQAYIPRFVYCTDNAAMIGMAGMFEYMAGKCGDLSITASARLPFEV